MFSGSCVGMSFSPLFSFDLKEEEDFSVVKITLFHWKSLLLIRASRGAPSKGPQYTPANRGQEHTTQRGHGWPRSAGQGHSRSRLRVPEPWPCPAAGPFVLS